MIYNYNVMVIISAYKYQPMKKLYQTDPSQLSEGINFEWTTKSNRSEIKWTSEISDSILLELSEKYEREYYRNILFIKLWQKVGVCAQVPTLLNEYISEKIETHLFRLTEQPQNNHTQTIRKPYANRIELLKKMISVRSGKEIMTYNDYVLKYPRIIEFVILQQDLMTRKIDIEWGIRNMKFSYLSIKGKISGKIWERIYKNVYPDNPLPYQWRVDNKIRKMIYSRVPAFNTLTVIIKAAQLHLKKMRRKQLFEYWFGF